MAGSLIKIQETTVSSSTASVTLTGIDSTYDVYMVRVSNVQPVTDNKNFLWRVTKSGTAQSDSEYDYSYSFLKAYADFSESGFANQSYFFLAQIGTPAQEQQNGVITIYNAFDSNEHTMIQHESSYWTSISKLAGAIGSAVYTQASSVDGFEIAAVSGNLDKGKFVLYEVT